MKVIIFIFLLIFNVNVMASIDDSTHSKKYKCRRVGISKIDSKKSIKRNKRSIKKDILLSKKIRRKESKKKYPIKVMPKFSYL